MPEENKATEMVKITSWSGVRYEPIIVVQGTPWERQTDQEGRLEPTLWHNRFNLYRLLGPERTMTGAYAAWREQQGKEPPKSKAGRKWTVMAKMWRWKERAEAWDTSQIEMAEDKWLQRRELFRDKMWEIAAALIARAEQMARLPITRVTKSDVVEEGSAIVHRTIVIEPIRFRQRDIASFYETAAKLAAQASGLGQADVDWMLNVDVSKLSTEQLEQLAEGKPIQDVIQQR